MATGYLTGTGFSLNFGLHTAAGTYTVEATHAVSGCRNNMAGSATINILPLGNPNGERECHARRQRMSRSDGTG